MAKGVLFRQSSGAAGSSLGAAGESSASRNSSSEAECREFELLYLAHEGSTALVEALLSQGVDVNFADFDGRTALHVASCEGHLDVVRVLLSRGAKVNARDRWGSTPLADAEHYQNGDVCRLLIDHGANSIQPPLKLLDSISITEFEVNPSELQFKEKTFTKKKHRLATWRGIDVFVKRFKENFGEKELISFREELSLIQRLRHPNIVQFLGAVTKSSPVMIIFEYMPEGDLYEYLKQSGTLKLPKVLDFALDIARGLNFMHEYKPGAVIHRDLKPKNILQDNTGHLKVADLGLSKVLKNAAQAISEDGPPPLKGSSCRYMAPEVFKGGAFGKEVDVFAFGLILQEMIEGAQPMSDLRNEDVPSAYADEDKRPPFKASSRRYPGGLKSLIEECWHKDPKKRPTFTQIIDELERVKAKYPRTKWRLSSFLW
ncbi:hypothetical protein KP509_34G001700 [Ceratopteris richardii]|uniref:Protein kinase domain-containing protein n=1 Tax=Ceratopteris richardii TaxID=49495 RepID=A0A8T2QI46_CERRI|nr:hypothetical protein KP509_34G001700 [Ceratopteris richardii]KAH7283329.1 hypothetical protein KP509_34G001700 [Ceratopteris richardii]